MASPYNLQRFVEAQNPVFEQVCLELRRGRKTSHWIWFIFPQIEGLGFSEMSRYFAISGRDEAAAYLEHPVLGPRLRECTRLVATIPGKTVEEIFGSPDDMKFRSSMTLFAQVADDNQIFLDALGQYFQGEPDQRTLSRLAG